MQFENSLEHWVLLLFQKKETISIKFLAGREGGLEGKKARRREKERERDQEARIR